MMGLYKRRKMIISGQAPRSLSITNNTEIKCDINLNSTNNCYTLFVNETNTNKKQASIINFNRIWFLFFIIIYSLLIHYCYALTTSTIISSKSSHNLNNRSNTAIRYLINQNPNNNHNNNGQDKNKKQLNLSSAKFSTLINSRSQSKFFLVC